MGCGLVVMAAARAAKKGAELEQVLKIVSDAIQRTHIVGMISDIGYLLGGHRLSLPGWHLFLGKLGTLIRFKLAGKIHEAGKVRGIGMYFSEKKALTSPLASGFAAWRPPPRIGSRTLTLPILSKSPVRHSWNLAC